MPPPVDRARRRQCGGEAREVAASGCDAPYRRRHTGTGDAGFSAGTDHVTGPACLFVIDRGGLAPRTSVTVRPTRLADAGACEDRGAIVQRAALTGGTCRSTRAAVGVVRDDVDLTDPVAVAVREAG